MSTNTDDVSHDEVTHRPSLEALPSLGEFSHVHNIATLQCNSINGAYTELDRAKQFDDVTVITNERAYIAIHDMMHSVCTGYESSLQ